jgi:hypothetical protein
VREKNAVTGYDEKGAPTLQAGLGLDSRFMFMTYPRAPFVPMLLEVGGVLAYGRLLAYASVGPRRAEAPGIPYSVLSREHWLQFRFTDQLSVRGGRMVLPFGIRQPDHTAYTRTGMGLGYYGQSYGGELDYITERMAVQVAGFGGDFTQQAAGLREAGVAGSITFNVDGRASIGMSGLYGNSDLVDRIAGAWFARIRLVGASYLMAELDAQHRTTPGLVAPDSLATFARLGWFVLESLDVFLEHGLRIEKSWRTGANDNSQSRYIAGASWWVVPWVELAPQVRLETWPDTGVYTAGLFQLHIYY